MNPSTGKIKETIYRLIKMSGTEKNIKAATEKSHIKCQGAAVGMRADLSSETTLITLELWSNLQR